VPAEAERAGGRIVMPAQSASWGGYFGHFPDPDGYLRRIAAGHEGMPNLGEQGGRAAVRCSLAAGKSHLRSAFGNQRGGEAERESGPLR
jgi:hypothetical protein